MIRLPTMAVQQAAVRAGRRRHLGEHRQREAAEALAEQRARGSAPATPRPTAGRGRIERAPLRCRCAAALAERAQRYDTASSAHATIPSRFDAQQQHERATARTMKVMTNRIRPSAISDEV